MCWFQIVICYTMHQRRLTRESFAVIFYYWPWKSEIWLTYAKSSNLLNRTHENFLCLAQKMRYRVKTSVLWSLLQMQISAVIFVARIPEYQIIFILQLSRLYDDLAGLHKISLENNFSECVFFSIQCGVEKSTDLLKKFRKISLFMITVSLDIYLHA